MFKKTLIPIAVFIILLVSLAEAQTTYYVGPTRYYTSIGDAIAVCSDGDKIEIDDATYNEYDLHVEVDLEIEGNISYPGSVIIETNSNGRGILVDSIDEFSIRGVTIRNGVGPISIGGGAIYFYNVESAIVENCRFIDNYSPYDGGAICTHTAGSLVLDSCYFYLNEANASGGAVCLMGTYTSYEVEIFDNYLEYNVSNEAGGALYLETGGNATVSRNQLYNNSNVDGGGSSAMGGGAIYCPGYDTIEDNYIFNNTSEGYGGGMYVHGLTVAEGNLICNNTGENGGGVTIAGTGGNFDGNTIYGNTATIEGGGIFVEMYGDVDIINTIVWDNSPDQIDDDDGNLDATYCDIGGGWAGTGNIDHDPACCAPDYDEFSISSSSCCYQTGYNGVNIGALGVGCSSYEYLLGDASMYATSWPPSLTGGDATYLLYYFYGSNEACEIDGIWLSADVNASCSVTMADITVLTNYFRGLAELKYCPYRPPLWFDEGDLPGSAPAGWPNCE